MTKLYEERSRDLGEEVDAQQLQSFIERHNLDTMRAHCCWSFCYAHDDDFVDETGAIHRQCHVQDDDEMPEEDLCTRLWSCLSGMFWCCGCWCQCFGMCALAQEEREVNRLTNSEERKIDYLTFQPYSECEFLDCLFHSIEVVLGGLHLRHIFRLFWLTMLLCQTTLPSSICGKTKSNALGGILVLYPSCRVTSSNMSPSCWLYC